MILIRHGQSHFNALFGPSRIDPGIVDPGLTEQGRQEIRAAVQHLATRDIGRIITSPYQRTLETTEIILGALDLPVAVDPLVRERAYFTCDIGTPRSELVSRWPRHRLDHLPELWWDDPEESEADMMRRCQAFLDDILSRDDWPQVLVVTHYAFIEGLTGRTVRNGEIVHFDPTARRRA